MKKLIIGLGIILLVGTSVTPIVASHNSISKNTNSIDNLTQSYQTSDDWQNYLSNNTELINFIRRNANISSTDAFKGVTLEFAHTKENVKEPIGTLLMNGKIQTTGGQPTMVTQHIIDNSKGSSPITMNYDSKQITKSATIMASLSTSFTDTISTTAGFDIGFVNGSVSDTLSFDLSASLSVSDTATETVNFDKFSTTVAPGKKEEDDYVVMENEQIVNMVLKARIDVTQSYFNFASKKVAFTEFNSDSINQSFATLLYMNNYHIKYDNGFLGIDKFNDPNFPVENQLYNTNSMFIYLPISFQLDGYTTLITQTDL